MTRGYVPILRRRREGKTDYGSRKKLIIGKIPFVAPRISNKNVAVQVIRPTMKGDNVLASAHSRELLKMGWKGSLKATPASYLVGLLGGLRAVKLGLRNAVVYLGNKPFVRNSRIAAIVKGLRDAGLTVPADEATFPKEERITGVHISEWAQKISEIKQRRPAASKRSKKAAQPSEFQSNFAEVRELIMKISRGESS